MVLLTTKVLDLVISAIKDLCKLRGSTSQEIRRYISSVYNIPSAVARRQMQSALKRGVTCGILKKTGNLYSLPIDDEITRQEVAIQEIGLLDLYCQRRVQRSRDRIRRRSRRRRRRPTLWARCVCGKRRPRPRRGECGPKSCRRRHRKNRRKKPCKCHARPRNRRIKNERKRGPRTKYSLGNDKLTSSNQTVTDSETTAAVGIEQSYSSMPPV